MAYGMIIDLKKCVGCYACVTSCKEANGTPPKVFRSRVVYEDTGTYPNVTRSIVPMLCMHCEVAPCVEQCPTGATTKGEDGVVTINKEECIGCQTCIQACPYDARSYHEKEIGYFAAEMSPFESVKYANFPENTVDKCDFCKGNGKLEAGEKPACVAACVTGARVFGDLEEIKAMAAEENADQLFPEQKTNPSVYYIPSKRY